MLYLGWKSDSFEEITEIFCYKYDFQIIYQAGKLKSETAIFL